MLPGSGLLQAPVLEDYIKKVVVPVIDLANFPMELEKLGAAVTGLGCFRVVNHGMSPALMEEMKAVARSLFQLPTEAKLRSVNNNIYTGGYINPSKFKFFEAFGIYDASSMSDIGSFCSLLDTTTQHREIISEYIVKLHEMSISIACKVAESVGYNLEGLVRQEDEWPCLVRLNSYKFRVEEDIGCIGAPPHTDSGFLTLLQEDECVGGFEIMDCNDNFAAIDPVPATFFVNIGDLGKFWSNGRLQSVKHRVVCKEAMTRISIAMFLLAPKDDDDDDDDDKAKHPKIYKEFVNNEYDKLRKTPGFRAGETFPFF